MTIKEARQAAGLTQQQVSDLTGIPARSIQNWEAGVRQCPEYVEDYLIQCLKQEVVKKRTCEWLDERWVIINMDDPARPADKAYYEGAIRAVECLGFSWIRNENGKHKLFNE